jgi:DNA helicase-2/ATP-dependent DNA helicase PcrA
MRFHADLHVHSKYSRATSRDLDLEHLAHWAARKGVGLIATGDFTHPAWCAELKDKLVPAEPGLFRLRDDIEASVAATLPAACRMPVRFMLEVEISTIYKKGDKTRKIHHLIYAPDFSTVDRINARLARIGNIASDGRPILGLDSRDMLEITLESGPGAYLIPAHIWTPWFAALGSQSGFDSIADCYGDLAEHIFAVETGLSSDPAMNWRVSFLDRYRLVSNSDAHSPGKLGREATTFDCDLDYFAVKRALETGAGYVGTVEFFPEEGKYHLDGHRKCEVRLTPRETLAHGGRCPVCGEPVTIGVEHRVEALADRGEDEATPPPTAGEVSNLVPLPEVLSEITASGAASKTVARSYDKLVATLGPELFILQSAPVEDVARATSSLLAEALTRLRGGQVIREAGYDGEYGVIRLFEESELKRLTKGDVLFDAPMAQKRSARSTSSVIPAERRRRESRDPGVPASMDLVGAGGPGSRTGSPRKPSRMTRSDELLAGLDDDQRAAAEATEGPLIIIAGPGSGKTRTLTHRIAHLVARGVPAAHCLAITFTRRAAAEMRERLAHLLGPDAELPAIHTFHSLGLAILRAHPGAAGLHRGFRVAGEDERVALLAAAVGAAPRKAASLLRAISKAKRSGAPQTAETAAAMEAYAQALAAHHAVDFDDLVGLAGAALAADPGLAAHYRERFRFVSVDEFQDVDEAQYRLLRLIAPPGSHLCVIGDPDQAIYGFRGADASCFERFRTDDPDARLVRLARNYRSSGTIVAASVQMIAAARADAPAAEIVRGMHERITVHAAASEKAEAEFVVQTIERILGGHSFFSLDSGRASGRGGVLSFADFAVLYRTDAQAAPLVEALARSGMPFRKHGAGKLGDDRLIQALLHAHAALAEADHGELPATLAAAATRLQQQETAAFDAAAIRLGLERLTALACSCDGDPARFADALALATEADFFDPRADRVSLLTLHAAKGLEFPVVFIVGLEDGLLPLRFGEMDEAGAAEERRLFYVGMTRAKDRLVLTRAHKRLWRGNVRAQAASPFLADIERELLRHQAIELPRRKPEDRQLSLF